MRHHPEGFFPHDDVMNFTPILFRNTTLVILFDDASGRHLFSEVSNGPPINKAVLINSEKTN